MFRGWCVLRCGRGWLQRRIESGGLGAFPSCLPLCRETLSRDFVGNVVEIWAELMNEDGEVWRQSFRQSGRQRLYLPTRQAIRAEFRAVFHFQFETVAELI